MRLHLLCLRVLNIICFVVLLTVGAGSLRMANATPDQHTYWISLKMAKEVDMSKLVLQKIMLCGDKLNYLPLGQHEGIQIVFQGRKTVLLCPRKNMSDQEYPACSHCGNVSKKLCLSCSLHAACASCSAHDAAACSGFLLEMQDYGWNLKNLQKEVLSHMRNEDTTKHLVKMFHSAPDEHGEAQETFELFNETIGVRLTDVSGVFGEQFDAMRKEHNNVVAHPRVSAKEADIIVTIVNSTPEDEAWDKTSSPWKAKKTLLRKLNYASKRVNYKDARQFLSVATSFYAKRARVGCWVTDGAGIRRCVVLYVYTTSGPKDRSAVWFDLTPASLSAKVHIFGSIDDQKRSDIGQKRAAALELPKPLWLNVCYECGNVESASIRHKTCSGCEDAKYCNEICQHSHWKVHKSLCKAPS